jgi:hypothetical protein
VPAQAEAMVSLIQTTIATVLGPLMAEQAALRQVVVSQAEQLVNQAETIGQLRAELAAARAPQSPQAGSGATAPVEPTTEPPARRWRPPDAWITPGVIVVVLAVIATVVVLAALPSWPW